MVTPLESVAYEYSLNTHLLKVMYLGIVFYIEVVAFFAGSFLLLCAIAHLNYYLISLVD